MIHQNPFISAFIGIPEFSWKNRLRHWLATSRWVPDFIQDFSPIKGYEKFRQLQPGDVVVDAGAFPGDYALFAAAKVGPSGHIYALEPDPGNREVLLSNIRKSGHQNITVIPKGLWHQSNTLQLNTAGLASSVKDTAGSQTIEVDTLDALVAALDLQKLDVLKMDIEGAELEALQGAACTLKKFRPYTCVASYHIVNGESTAARVEAALRAAGLKVRTDYPKHLTTYAS